jgi:hypothetical protein
LFGEVVRAGGNQLGDHSDFQTARVATVSN